MLFPAGCLPLALDRVSLRKPEERARAGSGEEILGLGTGTGSHPCSAAGLPSDCGPRVHPSGPLLPLNNKEMGSHSVKGGDSLLRLILYLQ